MLTHFVRSEPLKWNSGTLLELEDIKGGGSSKLDGCRPLAFIVFFSRNFFLNDDTSGQITFLSQRTNIETRESVQLFEYRPNLIQYKNLSYNIRRIQEFRLELDIKYSFNDLVKLASLLIFIIILFDTV